MSRTRKKSGTVKKQRPIKVKRTKRLNKNIAGTRKPLETKLQELKSTLGLLKQEGNPRTAKMEKDIENQIEELERQIELPPEPMPAHLRKYKSPSIKSHHAEKPFSLIITDFDNHSVNKKVDGLQNKDTIRMLKKKNGI